MCIRDRNKDGVREATDRLKNNKAPGHDRLLGELLKHGEDELVKFLHELILDVSLTETMPLDWYKTLICLIHKKGDAPE